MRITLNDRSTKQLTEVMKLIGNNNPTHCVQTMITTFLKSLHQSPYNIEEHTKHDQTSTKTR